MRWAQNAVSRCLPARLAIINYWPEYPALIMLDRRRSLGGCISETTGNTSSITTTYGTIWGPETARPALSRWSSPFQISPACRDSFLGRLAFADRRFVGCGLQACCAAERRVISAFPRMEPRLEKSLDSCSSARLRHPHSSTSAAVTAVSCRDPYPPFQFAEFIASYLVLVRSQILTLSHSSTMWN